MYFFISENIYTKDLYFKKNNAVSLKQCNTSAFFYHNYILTFKYNGFNMLDLANATYVRLLFPRKEVTNYQNALYIKILNDTATA